jgi:hypothetical protein
MNAKATTAKKPTYGTVVAYTGSVTTAHGDWVVTGQESEGRWTLTNPVTRERLHSVRTGSFKVTRQHKMTCCGLCRQWHKVGRACRNAECLSNEG